MPFYFSFFFLLPSFLHLPFPLPSSLPSFFQSVVFCFIAPGKISILHLIEVVTVAILSYSWC
jgi:hypothetical protein